MKVADYRNRVAFLVEEKTPNEKHGFDREWNKTISTYGNVETLAGDGITRTENAEPANTHKLTVRYRDDITRDMRVEISGLYFEILQIDTQIFGKKKQLEIFIAQERDVI